VRNFNQSEPTNQRRYQLIARSFIHTVASESSDGSFRFESFPLSLIMSVSKAPNNDYCDYRCPLSTRYASKEMRYNFSDQNKFSTWRKLWIYLAKAEMVCALNDKSLSVYLSVC